MNFLITGGAGFIGSYLVKKLLEDSHTVYVVDNNHEYKNRLPKNQNNLKAKFFDINDSQTLDKFIPSDIQIQSVIHLAANSDISKSFSNPSVDFDDTFRTTISVLNFIKSRSIKHLFFASSSAIFGELDFNISIEEKTGPLRPISHYGAAKLSSEAFINSYCESYDIKCSIFRFPNVIGENMTHGVIYDFYQKLTNTPLKLEVLGDGNQEKSYLDISDLCEAILIEIYSFSNRDHFIDIYNIGNIDTITISDIASLVVEQISPKAEIVFQGGDRGWVGDVPKFKFDVTKILKTGWKPKRSSRDSVIKAIESLQKKV